MMAPLNISVRGAAAVPGGRGRGRTRQHHVDELVEVDTTILVLVGLCKHHRKLPEKINFLSRLNRTEAVISDAYTERIFKNRFSRCMLYGHNAAIGTD